MGATSELTDNDKMLTNLTAESKLRNETNKTAPVG